MPPRLPPSGMEGRASSRIESELPPRRDPVSGQLSLAIRALRAGGCSSLGLSLPHSCTSHRRHGSLLGLPMSLSPERSGSSPIALLAASPCLAHTFPAVNSEQPSAQRRAPEVDDAAEQGPPLCFALSPLLGVTSCLPSSRPSPPSLRSRPAAPRLASAAAGAVVVSLDVGVCIIPPAASSVPVRPPLPPGAVSAAGSGRLSGSVRRCGQPAAATATRRAPPRLRPSRCAHCRKPRSFSATVVVDDGGWSRSFSVRPCSVAHLAEAEPGTGCWMPAAVCDAVAHAVEWFAASAFGSPFVSQLGLSTTSAVPLRSSVLPITMKQSMWSRRL